MSYIEINLANIANNYRLLRDVIGKNVTCGAAVKADAYGLGAKQVSQTLYEADCCDFFVAHIDEASTVNAKNKMTIFLLHGISNTEQAKIVHQNNIIPVLNSREQIELYNNYSQSIDQKLPAILNFDTGMGRLGLALSDIDKIKLDYIDCRMIMSHLACADEPDHPQNQLQLKAMQAICQLHPRTKASFANSSGIFLGRDYHFDLVRPGCALYGINPTPYTKNPIKPVVSIYSKILQRRILEQPQNVGYGATGTLKTGSQVFIIEYGYADGYPRSLSSMGKCYVDGHYLTIAGRVSMDLVIIDASALPTSTFAKASHVELLGEHILVDDVAKDAGTVGYEVLTNLSSRMRREYTKS